MNIIVTGASQGIGKALVHELVRGRHTVLGIARSGDKLEEIKKELNSPLFTYLALDVSDEKSVLELSQKYNPDAVVCAGAICEADTEPVYNHELVHKTMNINFFGTMNFVKAFLPLFIQKKSGHFISISSLAAWKPNHRSISYGASKAAIAMAFRGLDVKHKKMGVHFSTVYLGPVDTAMWEGKKSWILAKPQDIAQKLHRLILKPKTVVYMPFVSTTLSRISLLIPDALYAKISTFLFK